MYMYVYMYDIIINFIKSIINFWESFAWEIINNHYNNIKLVACQFCKPYGQLYFELLLPSSLQMLLWSSSR